MSNTFTTADALAAFLNATLQSVLREPHYANIAELYKQCQQNAAAILSTSGGRDNTDGLAWSCPPASMQHTPTYHGLTLLTLGQILFTLPLLVKTNATKTNNNTSRYEKNSIRWWSSKPLWKIFYMLSSSQCTGLASRTPTLASHAFAF